MLQFGQLVTACHVRMLLKGEVLGLTLTNNLIIELERTHNGGVGVGALQRCEPGVHGAVSSHGALQRCKLSESSEMLEVV